LTTSAGASPSKRRILLATVVALAVAGVILVVAVLPAEYGLDPLGTGRRLGLTGLAAVDEDGPLTIARGVNTTEETPYKVDTVEIRLRPARSVEYKYHLETGRGFVYSWKATGKIVYDFHGQPDGKPAEDARSYEKRDAGQESDQANGAFTAPFTGVHGWYFENTGSTETVITLTSAGYYSRAEQFMDKGGHFVFQLDDLTAGTPKRVLTP
jgi:hypothetical protein